MFIKYSTGQIIPKKSRGKVKKKTYSKRRVKKKVTLSANENIISDGPDAALELAKSISQIEAEEAKEAEAARKTKLKGAPSLTPEEQEDADIMQALKESKKTSKRQPSTRGSNEGTSSKPRVPDESTIVSTTSNEGTGGKPGVPDEEKNITEENDDKDGDADDEGDDHISDTQDADDEDAETESDKDDIFKYKIRVRKDEDEEMINAKVDDSDKGFGDQILKLSFDSSLVSIVKDTTDAKINSLLEVMIHSEVPHTQSPSVLSVPVFVISEPTIPTPVQETPSTATKTSLPPSSITTTPSVPQQTKTLIPIPTITTDAPTITIAVPKSNALTASQVPSVVDNYLGSKVGDKQTPTVDLEQGSEKSALEILQMKREQAKKQQTPKFTIKSTDKGKKTKRRRIKEFESSKKPSSTKETPKGKAPTKGSKNGKSASTKEPVEEPIVEVVMDDAGDDVARDDNQPQDTSKPKTRKTLNPNWFKQPTRPPTPNPEWNKHQDPLTFNDLMATPIDFSKYVLNGLKIENLTQDILLGPTFNLLKDILDWNNPEGDRYPFDLSKPLPLQGPPGHRTIAADYFFNNDLEYLKTYDPEVTYTSSIMKTKVARYEIKVSKFSKHNVYSTKAILGVKSVSVKKLHGYGHLEEIVVKRSDQQLYKFKEGDFVDLHLNDIEDMIFLAIQHKLFHLYGSVIVNFIVALRMFTRTLILKRRVEDLQLGVESDQKKLNITKPQKTFLEIKFK
ncbi:retrovirus-related pol polyprotein from transposon TNT 1-94 [Tanacetum coccineum]